MFEKVSILLWMSGYIKRIIEGLKNKFGNRQTNDGDAKLQSKILYASYVLMWSITSISVNIK